MGGIDENDVWIAGDVILHREGGAWVRRGNTGADPMGAQVPDNLFAVWANGKNDVWMAGQDGKTWRWNGVQWQQYTSPAQRPLYALWGRATNEVWAVGDPYMPNGGAPNQANLQQWNGSAWTPRLEGMPTVGSYYRVWGRGKDEVFAVGGPGLVRWDGTRWSTEASFPRDLTYNAVWADASTVVAAGTGGSIARKRGGGEFTRERGGDTYLLAVQAFSANEVWAVGYPGLVRRFDGSTWSTVTDLPQVVAKTEFKRLWGSGPDNLRIVGGDGNVLHRVGGTWNFLSAPKVPASSYQAVYGTARDNVWLVGSGGVTARCDDQERCTRIEVPSGITASITGVWGSAPGDMWAVGSSGTLLRFDNLRPGWTKTNLPTSYETTNLHAVWGSGPSGDVWIVGASTVLRYSRGKQAIEPMQVPPAVASVTFFGVHGTSNSDVWLVGSGGLVAHYNGKDWAYQNSGAVSHPLFDVYARDGQVWAVGYGAAILHYPR